jgi:hypothetical protein
VNAVVAADALDIVVAVVAAVVAAAVAAAEKTADVDYVEAVVAAVGVVLSIADIAPVDKSIPVEKAEFGDHVMGD